MVGVSSWQGGGRDWLWFDLNIFSDLKSNQTNRISIEMNEKVLEVRLCSESVVQCVSGI
jgi:hypothetical protein